MTWNDAMAEALCALIAGFDQRFETGTPATTAWRLAANAGGWDFKAALEAVQRIYTRPLAPDENLPRIVPGHVTTAMRQARPGGSGPRSVAELRARQPAGTGSSPEHRRRLLAGVAAELEARGVRSRVQARKPAWDADRVLPDVDAPAALPAAPVDLDAARTRLRAMTRNGADGPSGAFDGRQV
ncbi:hypothetical protein GS502_11015 [Rhodococcus hoagii]|nr:hypothetical protein [Prescottella equi]